MEKTARADRTVLIAWIVAAMSVIAAWQALSMFKSASAEWTAAIPLFAPGIVFVPAAVEIGRRFGVPALAGFTAVGVVAATLAAGPPLLDGMDIGGSLGFQWVPAVLFAIPFAAVAFVEHRLTTRRWVAAACDLPIAIVVLLGATVVAFAIVVAALVVSLPRIG